MTIYDPLSNQNPALRTPFPEQYDPQPTRIDMAAIEMMKRLPLPDGVGIRQQLQSQWRSRIRPDQRRRQSELRRSNMTVFGRYSISPTQIFEPPIFGDASGPALNGGQLGTAPSKIQVAGLGGTYTSAHVVVVDANIGYTRQKLGAQGPDVVNFRTVWSLTCYRFRGRTGPTRCRRASPRFQIGGWTNIGNDNTGNPFLFRDNQLSRCGVT